MSELESSVLVDKKGLSTTMSPISMLSHDVLALIFEINSETIIPTYSSIVQERPLYTARATSQVCQQWRALLLDLPRIWGRLIDLNALKDGKTEWREEVLRRTRSSPLWIVGDIPGLPTEDEFPMDIGYYFTRLLKSWDRIQKLDVMIYGDEISEDIQNAFLSPAPILNLFAVELPDVYDPLLLHTLLPNSTQSLFSNHAPSLLTIKADRFAFQTDSAWLANIRNIQIPIHIEAPGILDLLSRMPLLETLFLYHTGDPESWDPFDGALASLSSRIDLPHLSAMSLGENLPTCTVILDRVSPSKNCSFSFDCSYHTPPPAHIKATLKERLPTYIVNYFTTHTESSTATDISLELNASFGIFSFQVAPGGRTFFRNRVFINPDGFDIVMSLIQAFVASNLLSPCLFNNVTKLRISLTDIPISMCPDLYAMLLTFQSVEHLITNENGIRYILMVSTQDYHYDAQPELFPKIHTLKINQIFRNGENEDDPLLQFLERRRDVGFAIAKLDLTNVPFEDLRDFSALERVDGLEVVWDTVNHEYTVSYICGSGEGEDLRFTSVSEDPVD